MEDRYMDKKVRELRRFPLVKGVCSCGKKAELPWKDKKYCVTCWVKIPKGEEVDDMSA